jgi:hypothetical protein
MTSYWFKPKRYGYGAMPVTWQGWAVTLGTVAAMVAVSLYLRLTEQPYWALALLIAFDALALGVLMIVSRRKTDGEWRWRWGDRQAAAEQHWATQPKQQKRAGVLDGAVGNREPARQD